MLVHFTDSVEHCVSNKMRGFFATLRMTIHLNVSVMAGRLTLQATADSSAVLRNDKPKNKQLQEQ